MNIYNHTTTYRKALDTVCMQVLSKINFRYYGRYEICTLYFRFTVSATVDWSVDHIRELTLTGVLWIYLGRVPLSKPAANRWPTGDPFPMERIWVTNRWPTGGRKAPGHQTPALPRISKNRRAGNFYAIWGGAWFLKIDGRFDLDE